MRSTNKNAESLPNTSILFRVTHARLLALGFTIRDTLAASAFSTLHALSAVWHVKADWAVCGRACTQSFFFTSSEIGRAAFGTNGHEIAACKKNNKWYTKKSFMV